MMPQRIQRKRTRGWTMPTGAIYVGRPTPWGNPFRRLIADPDMPVQPGFLVSIYRLWLTGHLIPELAATFVGGDTLPQPPRTEAIQHALRGKDLACWCPLDQPCHADILLEIANAKEA